MNVLITLAGKSKRFHSAGYKIPKFLLSIGKSTVIAEILKKFDENDNFHFVLTKQQVKENKNIMNYLKKLRKNTFLNIINSHDKGPVYSALNVNSIKDDEDVIISYCDYLIEWDYKKFKREIYGYDGAIVSFKGFHPSSFSGTLYCYLKVKDGLIKNLREKKSFSTKPHQEYASAGLYYFKNFGVFKESGKKALEDKKFIKSYKEIYVSLPYIYMLKKNLNILNFEAEKFISLGTPKDYEEFVNWLNFFKKNDKKN